MMNLNIFKIVMAASLVPSLLFAECIIPSVEGGFPYDKLSVKIDFKVPRSCRVIESNWDQTYAKDDGMFQYRYKIPVGSELVLATNDAGDATPYKVSLEDLLRRDRHNYHYKSASGEDNWGSYWHYAPWIQPWLPISSGKVVNDELIYVLNPLEAPYTYRAQSGPHAGKSHNVQSQLLGNHYATVKAVNDNDNTVRFYHGFCDYKTLEYPQFNYEVSEQYIVMECSK